MTATYQYRVIETILHRKFSASDVLKLYPWMSGTTFFNRVRSGRIPTENKPAGGKNVGIGTGAAYKLNFPALIHTGVDDELIACGVRGDVGDIHYDFWPEWPDEYNPYKPAGGGLNELLYFYQHHNYDVGLTIDVGHERRLGSSEIVTPSDKRRQKVGRTHLVIAHSVSRPPALGCEITRIDISHPTTVFSSVRINVQRIYDYVMKTLGITPEITFSR